MKKKYAFYCSGNATRLIKFYDEYLISEYKFELILYDGNNKSVEKKLLKKFKNKLIIYRKELQKSNLDSISNLLLYLLKKHGVDFLFCFGNQILRKPLIEIYRNKIINFHPSLLPDFPGLRSIDQALEAGADRIGNTAHFIDNGIDTGPIILQNFILQKDYKTYDDVLNLQIPLLKEVWNYLDEDKIIVESNKVIILN